MGRIKGQLQGPRPGREPYLPDGPRLRALPIGDPYHA